MNAKFLLPLAAVCALALAACNDTSTPASTPADTAPSATAPAAPAAAPAAPAATSPMTAITPEQAMQALQAQTANMTDAQKAETVASARKAAEDGARAQNLTADQVKQAGDMAEAATKQALGIQ